jgi:hypothetical protein
MKTYRVLFHISEGRRTYVKARSEKHARRRIQTLLDAGFDLDDSDILHGAKSSTSPKSNHSRRLKRCASLTPRNHSVPERYMPLTSEEKIKTQNELLSGSVELSYQDATVIAPVKDILEALDILETEDRSQIMQSVNSYLKDHWHLFRSGEATQEQKENMVHDIATWYANEIIEGRAPRPELKPVTVV